MSYFIVLHGTSGSGKTTIAKDLAKVLNAKHILLDLVLKENNLDNHESGSCLIASSDFIKGLDIVLPVARKLLHQNQIVIFDGCIYHREVLDYLINNLKFDSYVFTLKSQLDICIKRDKTRKSLGESVVRGVYELVNKNDFGTLIVTENKTVQETFDEIISYLPNSSIN